MGPVLESLFEFLFKYRPVVFEKGQLAFTVPGTLSLALLAGLAVALSALLTYAGVRAKSSPRDRVVLGIMRAAALALILFCLLRPVLILSAAVPQRNFLGILIDDSRSMQIADVDGKPRSEFLRQQFGARDSALIAALSERFMLRFFRFSGTAERIADVSELGYGGTRTHIGPALEQARQELAAVPLAGLILITDGADNSQPAAPAGGPGTPGVGTTPLAEQIRSLDARSVPVFTVGLGREKFARDIEISRVEAPRSALKGSSLVVDLLLIQSGFRGEKVRLVVEDSGRVISAQVVELAVDGEAVPVRVHVPASEAGARTFRFRIPPQRGEAVTQNNERDALIAVHDRKEKILYVEGEPRFELKFIRRAVAEDENLQLVALQRTAESKFLRLGVDDSLELVEGFPRTRTELFGYRGIILGSIEASFFTLDQLRMLADFVSERGGGLMMLGGRRAFAEGGYAGTPLSDVLPLTLGKADSTAPFFAEVNVELTTPGVSHPAMQVAGSEERSAARWKSLPLISTVNRLGRLKPGATALLMGRDSAGGRQVVLAHQRFGRGKTIALPIQDSWIWQMHADVPLDDLTHETFWRQMLRWLVSDVPGQVNVGTATDRVGPGEAVTLTAEVHDDTYLRVNNAAVVAHVIGPSGAQMDLPMEWTVRRDGEYRASFTAEARGVYEVRVDALRGRDTLASDAAFVRSAEPTSEFYDAPMRASLLKRIAEETGGRFYTPQTVASLPKDIVFTESGTTVQERKDLWDMPAVFLLLVALVAGEWGYRRARGLA